MSEYDVVPIVKRRRAYQLDSYGFAPDFLRGANGKLLKGAYWAETPNDIPRLILCDPIAAQKYIVNVGDWIVQIGTARFIALSDDAFCTLFYLENYPPQQNDTKHEDLAEAFEAVSTGTVGDGEG